MKPDNVVESSAWQRCRRALDEARRSVVPVVDAAALADKGI